jgi:hypothetical protein
MKKSIVIFISLIVICSLIATINNQDTATEDENQEETKAMQVQTVQEQTNADSTDTAIKISSDEYFDIVDNAIKKYIEPAGYTITRASTLRIPYYMVDCRTTDVDTANFKAETIKIAEDIYHAILEYEYKQPSIWVASHEIISLNFHVVENGETICGLTVQFDLTDIDRTKPFLENLKTLITP